jgi:hypothetical protein
VIFLEVQQGNFPNLKSCAFTFKKNVANKQKVNWFNFIGFRFWLYNFGIIILPTCSIKGGIHHNQRSCTFLFYK